MGDMMSSYSRFHHNREVHITPHTAAHLVVGRKVTTYGPERNGVAGAVEKAMHLANEHIKSRVVVYQLNPDGTRSEANPVCVYSRA